MGTMENGKYLRKLREKKVLKGNIKLSQAQLGKVIGVTRQTICDHEGGEGYFYAEKYLKLSKYFDVSIDKLLHGGKNRETELRKFVKQPIDDIDLNETIVQPDSQGKTLLDYVIEFNDFEKFELFYDKRLFVETLHNNLELMSFLVRKNKFEFLKKVIEYNVESSNGSLKKVFVVKKKFEFPFLDKVLYFDGEKPVYRWVEYYELDKRHKRFFDSILNCKSKEILDMLPYERIGEKQNDYPKIFYMALERNIVFIVEYYFMKYDGLLTQFHFDYAIKYNSTKVAIYIFKNADIQSPENLKQINNPLYIKEMSEELGFKTDEKTEI